MRLLQRRPPGATLTFLFADLRDYTTFVEAQGDAAATLLIKHFRRVVRAQLALIGGGEIKTEGDSFYLVFTTAHRAIQCAVAILHEVESATREHPSRPMQVGIGIHAGEPVALERQFVGSAVNLAARLGSAAQSGELLISETVRGLLRTSGLPPLTERTGLTLKGITDAPRAYSVDWRGMDYLSARDKPAGGVSVPSRRLLIAGLVAVAIVVVAGLAFLRPGAQPVERPSGQVNTSLIALPPHGPLLFEANLSALGAQRLQIVLGNPTLDHVRFLGDAIELEASAASWVSVSVASLAPDDLVADFAVTPVSGQGSYALWFRGAQGRQLQVQVAPQTGELTVQIARSFETSGVLERLFGPSSRIPPSRDAERRLAVSARGRDISVVFNGGEVAKATDPAPQGGSVGLLASAAVDRPIVVRLTALRIYGP